MIEKRKLTPGTWSLWENPKDKPTDHLPILNALSNRQHLVVSDGSKIVASFDNIEDAKLLIEAQRNLK